ncbi:MAG: Uncharacterized protein FD123_451 [Bacteroidetes bacterium]|nr:MAG: Uncharacterized protein FD123_451 [Bacteroidota bacterium]
MKYLISIPLLLLVTGLRANPTVQQRIYLASQLDELLRQSRADSVLLVERMAALEFHRMINAYRREQKTDTLQWNDTLWMASRNHCLWMCRNNKLSHNQEASTELFSGVRPGDRYDYVVNGNGRHSWSGENALYNWSGNDGEKENAYKAIARESFNQWKNSPGHNKNMLNPSSKVHGTAFIIEQKNGRTWGTDLFAYSPRGSYYNKPVKNSNQPKSITVVENTPAEKKTTAAGTPKKIEPSKVRIQLSDGLYGNQKTIKDDVLAAAAAEHARYLSLNKSAGHVQVKGKNYFTGVDPRHRVIAASHGFDKIRYRKKSVVESVTVIEIKSEQFNLNNTIKSIWQAWEQENPGQEKSAPAGIGIEVKRVKDTLKIYAVKLTSA